MMSSGKTDKTQTPRPFGPLALFLIEWHPNRCFSTCAVSFLLQSTYFVKPFFCFHEDRGTCEMKVFKRGMLFCKRLTIGIGNQTPRLDITGGASSCCPHSLL
jgi:hypothetical protein